MTKSNNKHYVFSARTTEEGLRRLNEIKRERGTNWDDLVIDAVAAHYGIDRAVLALPRPQKPAKPEKPLKAEKKSKGKKGGKPKAGKAPKTEEQPAAQLTVAEQAERIATEELVAELTGGGAVQA